VYVLGHGGSPAVAQWGEGCALSPSQASPGRGRWCGDRATVVKKRWWQYPVRAVLGHGEKRRRVGRGAVDDGRALPLYRGREVGRWPVVKMEKWSTLMGTEWLMFK
jgi:hypothetical protein